MKKQYDVVALGELLIDFTGYGTSNQGNPTFEANPGGAPCNVLAMLNRLGHETGFIGKVGDDMFGHQLKAALVDVGIGTDGLIMDEEVRTTLAFVQNMPDGDRDFSFYRNPGADMMLTVEDVNISMIEQCRIFHFGSLSMTHENCREATKVAIKVAKQVGTLISFDPNLREPLWNSLDEAREQIAYGMSQCDILKISDNEIVWFTGEEEYEAGVGQLQERFDIQLILVSLGKEGSMAYTRSNHVFVPAFLQDNTIDTTGAGDTFGACVLHYVLQHGLVEYSEAQLQEMLTFANAAASLVTTKKGALRVMPTRSEVERRCHTSEY